MLEREMRANMREYQGAVHFFQKIASCWSTHLVNMTCNLVSLQIVVSGRQLLLPDPVVATARGFIAVGKVARLTVCRDVATALEDLVGALEECQAEVRQRSSLRLRTSPSEISR